MSSPPSRRPVPASAGLARRLYAEGVPIAEICARTGLSTGAAYHWIDRELAPDGSVALKPLARRSARPMLDAVSRPGPRGEPAGAPPRARLLARLWRAAERQVGEIETRIHHAAAAEDGVPRPAAEAEKDARALALIARTLRELVAAEDETAGSPKDADDTVRDLDAFRRELARRLERMREEAEDGEAPAL